MNETTLERIERQIEGWPDGAVKSGWERMIEEARRLQQEGETRQRKEGGTAGNGRARWGRRGCSVELQADEAVDGGPVEAISAAVRRPAGRQGNPAGGASWGRRAGIVSAFQDSGPLITLKGPDCVACPVRS